MYGNGHGFGGHVFELFACFGCKGFLDISFSLILRFLVIFHILVYPFDPVWITFGNDFDNGFQALKTGNIFFRPGTSSGPVAES